MPKKAFFNNIGTILTYAVIGTLFNAFAIGLTLYGAYLAGAFPGIDKGFDKNLGVLEKDIKYDINLNLIQNRFRFYLKIDSKSVFIDSK